MKKLASIGFALLMVFAVFVPVVSALNDPTKEGYQSVVNPNPAGEKSPENIGHLDVLLACRAPQIGGEFTIVPVAVSAPFTNAARVDKAFVDQFVKQFGEPKTEQYLPDGTFDSNYAPGTYLLKQIDGNGGQPEFALVTLKAACAETVVFLGHGITPADEPKTPEPVIVIKEAKYGATYQRLVTPEVPAVPGVDAYYEHTTDPATVPCVHFHEAVAAYYEHANDGVDVAAHTEYAPAISHSHFEITAYKFFGFTLKVKCTNHAEHGEGYHVQTAACTAEYNYVYGAFTDTQPTCGVYQTRTVEATYKPCVHFHEAVAAYYEHESDPSTVPCVHYHAAVPAVPAVPAVYETVGTIIDVTAQVQEVVDTGVTSFKFMNGPNPGGIFSTDNVLLKTIVDPAYGQLKNVHIEFTVDGGAKQTINTQENQVVNLI